MLRTDAWEIFRRELVYRSRGCRWRELTGVPMGLTASIPCRGLKKKTILGRHRSRRPVDLRQPPVSFLDRYGHHRASSLDRILSYHVVSFVLTLFMFQRFAHNPTGSRFKKDGLHYCYHRRRHPRQQDQQCHRHNYQQQQQWQQQQRRLWPIHRALL